MHGVGKSILAVEEIFTVQFIPNIIVGAQMTLPDSLRSIFQKVVLMRTGQERFLISCMWDHLNQIQDRDSKSLILHGFAVKKIRCQNDEEGIVLRYNEAAPRKLLVSQGILLLDSIIVSQLSL